MQIVAKMKVLMSPPGRILKEQPRPCATPASAARQRTGTSFSSDHLADSSSRGDGRLSGQKRSGGSSARSPALPTH